MNDSMNDSEKNALSSQKLQRQFAEQDDERIAERDDTEARNAERNTQQQKRIEEETREADRLSDIQFRADQAHRNSVAPAPWQWAVAIVFGLLIIFGGFWGSAGMGGW